MWVGRPWACVFLGEGWWGVCRWVGSDDAVARPRGGAPGLSARRSVILAFVAGRTARILKLEWFGVLVGRLFFGRSFADAWGCRFLGCVDFGAGAWLVG